MVENDGGDVGGAEEPLAEERRLEDVAGARAAGNAHGVLPLAEQSMRDGGETRLQALRAQLLHDALPRGKAGHAGEPTAARVHVPVGREDDATGQVVAATALEVVEVVRRRDLDRIGAIGHLHERVIHEDG